jgi:hypothetical protein
VIDPKDIATEGLYPGRVSTFSVATLGYGFIEVTIEALAPGRGSANTTQLSKEKGKYKITIRVRYKDWIWQKEYITSDKTASVVAKALKVQLPEPVVVLTNVAVIEPDEPDIKVFKR